MPAHKKPFPKKFEPVIQIRGARQHNLKELDLDIQLGKLTVVTGPSGSGKSSLAFHTLYAEGQRRYVETFSPYVRQFFDRMDKPDVDRIDGIPPAIAIEQKNNIRTTRSTVGTLTEINDYLKLLFARASTGHDPITGEEIKPDSPDSAARWALDHLTFQPVLITFPVPVPAETKTQELFSFLNAQGYLRLLGPNCEILRTDDSSAADEITIGPEVQVIQDRLNASEANKARLLEALEQAFTLGKGYASITGSDVTASRAFTTTWTNPNTGHTLRPPSAALFTFNNPLGACPECRGFGRVIGLDLEKSVPDPTLSIRQGAIKPFQGERGDECQRDLIRNCRERGIDTKTAWEDLEQDTIEWIYYGDQGDQGGDSEALEEIWQSGGWYGVKGFFDWLESKSYKMHVRIFLSRYRSYTTCPVCRGSRLQPEALNFKFGGKTLPSLWQLPITDLVKFFDQTKADYPSAIELVHTEIANRLSYLDQVGLGYLTLDRPARTLSGGEIERVNLTSCLGASLSNTLFVLDEPTVGLHPRDIDRLVKVMINLRDKGNTLVVVEHEEAVMLAADELIDIGPKSGEAGGNLIYQGPVSPPEDPSQELPPDGTLEWLTKNKSIAVPPTRRRPNGSEVVIQGATRHNLRKVDVSLPLGLFTCLTGVSGSGKSTLAHDVIYAQIALKLGQPIGDTDPAPIRSIKGVDALSEVLLVDQSPLARTPRSTPAVLLGAFDDIRQIFAHLEQSRAMKLTPGFFSFNSGSGRCDRCAGAGSEKVEMQFLSDLQVTCPDCEGRRYKPSSLDIVWRGRSIADILELTTDQYLEVAHAALSDSDKKVQRHLQKTIDALNPMSEVGLGYVKLGQPVNTLSGGESQRLKICQILTRNTDDRMLLILDEPTTGLHFSDIERLLSVFQTIVDAGHSLLVIEHNLDVIKSCDYLIDLGPGAGAMGGEIVGQGTPEEISKLKTETARYLRPYLGKKTRSPLKNAGTKRGKSKTLKSNCIELRGAREHNLKNVSLDIPRDSLVVVSGLSGSGKSTLAFDILFAEGQRRFLDSMSAYARQFAEQLEKPEIDQLSGLPPTVAIEQRVSRGGIKSTVATVTEVWNFVRLLYAKLGTRYCPDCQIPVEKQSLAAIEKAIRNHLKKGEVAILAPVIRGRKGYHTDVAEWAVKQGFTKLLVDKQFKEAEGFERLARFSEHDIDVVVWQGRRGLDHPTLTRALEIGRGTLRILTPDKKFLLFSSEASCPSCSRSFDELDPRLFSFNSPQGWCAECRGHGKVPKRRPTFDSSSYESVLEAELDADRKVSKLDSDDLVECSACHGSRLKPESRCVHLQGGDRQKAQPISMISGMPVSQAVDYFSKVNFKTARAKLIGRDILPEIVQRLKFLIHVGLGYLQLDRSANTLSGGESQRIRLAAQLGSNLRGVLYVLDEPTIGLHPRDNSHLLETMIALRDRGNSLIVVEHDEDTIALADHLIDLGPGAGKLGGEIVFEGKPPQRGRTEGRFANPQSPTYQALINPIAHPMRGSRRSLKKNHQFLKLTGCDAHNLKEIDIEVPLHRLTVLTGVSGSGKSTLMHQCIAVAANHGTRVKRHFKRSSGFQKVKSTYEVDQSPIGKTSRSCPATYVKIFDEIRKLYAQLPDARVRGYDPSRFSFNTGEGRCPVCEGNGRVKLEMDFLPTSWVACESCDELRYSPATLEVRFRGKNIGEILQMSIGQAAAFFESQPRIAVPLQLLADTGLGYLQLGQPSPTLSGGEAQRIKLVSQLIRGRGAKASLTTRQLKTSNLYLIEEPTVGLHLEDVRKLIDVLHRLVDEGHTVIVIEHHMAVAAEADWILDVGPGAGEAGGSIVAAGPPEVIAASKTSVTAPFLAVELANN